MLSRWLALSTLVILLDQISKAAISSHFANGESLHMTGFFNLVLAHNQGAAFSFLNDAGGWQRWFFSVIALVASAWIIWLLRKHGEQKLFCFALAMILGGAVGNLIDRVIDGYVVDFLDFESIGAQIGVDRRLLAFNVWQIDQKVQPLVGKFDVNLRLTEGFLRHK